MNIIISFQPIHFKLFLSKKRCSLLVINASCINGSKNRIKTKDAALVHIRQSSKGGDTLCKMASSLLLQKQTGEEDSLNEMKKGRRVECDTTKQIVVRANAHIERNRKGDRLIECTEVICIQDSGDAPYLPVNYDDEENYEYITGKNDDNPISLKIQRSQIFADWIVHTYGEELLSQRTGVLDVAGGNGETCRHLTAQGIKNVTLLDPNPRTSGDHAYTIIPQPLNYDGSDLTSRNDEIGNLIRNCSFICGLHPDQATEPIVSLALRLDVPFAILPCCVMPSLFPHRVQKKHCDPVRSYSAFCQYLLDMAPDGEVFLVDHLPFVGRNKVIFRLPRKANRNKTTTSKSAK